MSLLAAGSFMVVGGWCLATALAHVPALTKWIRERDALRLLPSWNFFAPNPCVHDYSVAYRDRTDEGLNSEWRSLLADNPRNVSDILWNPKKRVIKTIFDSVSSLVRILSDEENAKGSECLSIPYLVLLNAVVQMPRLLPDSIERQFVITRTPGSTIEKVDLVYASGFHRF